MLPTSIFTAYLDSTLHAPSYFKIARICDINAKTCLVKPCPSCQAKLAWFGRKWDLPYPFYRRTCEMEHAVLRRLTHVGICI